MPGRSTGSIGRWRMAEPFALAALAIEATFGWPPALYDRIGHPVGGFARLIGWCEARWNRGTPARRRRLGIVTVVLLVALAGGAGWALEEAAERIAGRWSWVLIALLAAPGLAQRSLHDHVRAVAEPLAAGDLPVARAAAARIVGRDTETLDEAGVSRAAIESLAESFCDGVAAPLFWLLLLGLPGLWAYKAINTADSLIGHREARWRDFGWAAARLDDVANLVPARLAGVLVCLAGGRALGPRAGFAVMRRDARLHASPNAGWPEAAMAGVLGLRLGGPVAYDGAWHDKPWIGDGRAGAGAADVARALDVYRHACLCLWIVAGLVAWRG